MTFRPLLTLSPRDRRTLVVGAATVATLVLVARGLPAWRAWDRRAREAAWSAATELARAESRLRVAGPLRDSLAAQRRQLAALTPTLLGGETQASAGAALAARISSAADAAGVKLGAVQIAADSTSRAVFARIRVRADATGDIQGLATFLATLEGDSTMLAVRTLAITQPDVAQSRDRMEMLRIRFMLEGLMRPSAWEGRR